MQDASDNGGHALVGNFVVTQVPPPDQGVGGVEIGVGKAALDLVETRLGHLEAIALDEMVGDRAVDIFGIDTLGRGSLAPNTHAERRYGLQFDGFRGLLSFDLGRGKSITRAESQQRTLEKKPTIESGAGGYLNHRC